MEMGQLGRAADHSGLPDSSVPVRRRVAARSEADRAVGPQPIEVDLLSEEEARFLRQVLRGQARPPKGSAERADGRMPGPPCREGDLVARFAAGVKILERLGVAAPADAPTDRENRGSSAYLPHPTATSLTIVFNGNQSILALPQPLLTRHESNLLLIRDPQRCFGLAGLPGFGATYSECLKTLRLFMNDRAIERVFCVGISAGGSSALRFGTDLHAEGLLCFSTPTTLDLADDPGAELSHYPQLAGLYRRDRSQGINLARHYQVATPRPGLLLVHGGQHARDSWLAEQIACVEGVELVEIVGFGGHRTDPLLTHCGVIPSLLDRLYTLRRVGGQAAA